MIKYTVVHLAQIPAKSVLVDIVVEDVPHNYGMLFSISWASKLGGTLQMDMNYAIIMVFGGDTRRFYRETELAYTINDLNHPNNCLVYSKYQDLGCFIFSINDEPGLCTKNVNVSLCENNELEGGMWKMYFHGAFPWEGVGAGIILISPFGKLFPFSFRLQLKQIPQIMFVNIEAARRMKVVNLIVYGGAELIVKQIRKVYQDKPLRTRSYKNFASNLIECFFFTFNIHAIPKHENQQIDSLVVESSTSIPPEVPISNMKWKLNVNLQFLTMSNIGRYLKMNNKLKNFWKWLKNFMQPILIKNMKNIMNKLIIMVILILNYKI
jgi:hypothetical protein